MWRLLLQILLFLVLSNNKIYCDNDFSNDHDEEPSFAGTPRHNLLGQLRRIQKHISHNATLLKEYADHFDPNTPAGTIFQSRRFEKISETLPIEFWSFDIPSHTLGNNLGNYFDAVGCAALAGLHFVAILKNGHPLIDANEPFYNALPYLIPHPQPALTRDIALKNVAQYCTCHRFCWKLGQPWALIIPTIRYIMRKGLLLHLSVRKHGLLPEERGLVLNNQTDMYKVQSDQFLPLIPDVAVHYRCSDNTFGGMGCLSFKTILDRIPAAAKYVYIFSEYGSRMHKRVMEKHSDAILLTLVNEIEKINPHAIVVVKRGSNPFTTSAQFAFANVTICSVSTFCLYPAIARTKTTYFPIGRGDYINTFNEVHPNFHFLRTKDGFAKVNLGYGPSAHGNLFFSNFTETTTTDEVISTLRLGLDDW